MTLYCHTTGLIIAELVLIKCNYKEVYFILLHIGALTIRLIPIFPIFLLRQVLRLWPKKKKYLHNP